MSAKMSAGNCDELSGLLGLVYATQPLLSPCTLIYFHPQRIAVIHCILSLGN